VTWPRALSVSVSWIFISACVSVSCLALSCLALGQEGNGASAFLPNQEVRVHDLPLLTAPSRSRSAALATALEMIVHDKAVCCGKDSALEDVALYAELSNALSLKELSAKLQGRHLLSDSRAIAVNAQYVPQSAISPGLMIGALLEQHAPIIEWKSHIYVLYGAIFDETRFYSGVPQYSVRKLLLMDPRFSDQRRDAEFKRETDDFGKVQGLLMVTVVGP
jgi:hypothetical protein